ncbi:hypothetical protein Bca52824_085778 [Brassica carinata]|uniref:Uncharacterized protein n=1 Tax=Brassica carinata TaxID=52824 RepID=A0A8X7TL74_BRACI|nr:hypothetical protein Bca52824_085778 [Brassica carinata]
MQNKQTQPQQEIQETIPTDTKAATTTPPAHSSCHIKIAYMSNVNMPMLLSSLMNPIIPQTGVSGIRHSTFESLRVGRISQSIASNLLAYGIPLTSRKTVSLWESRFSSLMKSGSIVKVDRFKVARCSSMYNIIDHPFLIRFISPTIIYEVITDVVGQIQYVQGSDLSKETTRVVIRLLIDP